MMNSSELAPAGTKRSSAARLAGEEDRLCELECVGAMISGALSLTLLLLWSKIVTIHTAERVHSTVLSLLLLLLLPHT